MKLEELVRRARLEPWSASGKIPWHEPEFSARMLREHLSQEHGRASRRFADIDRHVAWLDQNVLHSSPGRVLDLGCGPGLYTARLARLGHACVGIDFSPASIEYARAEARAAALPCEYLLGDLRECAFGSGFGAALLLFGELNTFPAPDAHRILAGARSALAPGGALVLELHPEPAVRARAEPGTSSFRAERGLFGDDPHLCLVERRFDERARCPGALPRLVHRRRRSAHLHEHDLRLHGARARAAARLGGLRQAGATSALRGLGGRRPRRASVSAATMSEALDALILDLLESIATRPKPYREVIDAWRTSCPRLPVWEEASDRELLELHDADGALLVRLTASGRALLSRHRSASPAP